LKQLIFEDINQSESLKTLSLGRIDLDLAHSLTGLPNLESLEINSLIIDTQNP